MQQFNNEQTNFYHLGQEVYSFEIDNGIPKLQKFKIFSITGPIKKTRADRVYYGVSPIEGFEEDRTFVEEELFISPVEAAHAFNKGQEHFEVTIKTPINE
ncbi:MAG TPA: hypothetical protein VLB84_13125 [Bacteroidia bacterium]|nr:hypothetical protein [Bacteroidia bacterium]